MRMRAIAAWCVVASALAGVEGCGCGVEKGPRVIKFSHITSETSHWQKGAERFAALVAERTGGRYEVKVYPGGQIANHNQRTELQMLQSGAIEMTFESPIILALFLDGRFDAFSTPWLFGDLETARRACTGPLRELAKGWLEEKGLEGIGVGVNGFRQLTNSVRAVKSPEDIKGIKIRVAGTDLFLETFKALGANPLTMNFGEVFTSLQEGVIDGQENPLAIIYTSRLYEVQKYLTLWNYVFDPIILCVNGRFWGTVPEGDREIMEECAREAMEYQWDYAEQLESDIVKELKEKGMEVVTLTAEEVGAFRREVKPAHDFLEAKIGRELVEEFRGMVAKAEKAE